MDQLGYVFIVGIVMLLIVWVAIAYQDRKNSNDKSHHHA